MTINMVLSLVMVPMLVYIFRPKFVAVEHHFLSESADDWAEVRRAKQAVTS